MSFFNSAPPMLWGVFLTTVVFMLALDLGVFHRQSHVVRAREAALWSGVWVLLALAFNVGVYVVLGHQRALEFGSGYLIEKALALDNVFVFVVVFSTFAIPRLYQHRILFWGVFGALLMRAVFIGIGAAAVQRFHWVMYLFGLILVFTGIKLLMHKQEPVSLEHSRLLLLLRRFVPMSSRAVDGRWTVIENGRRVATPMLMALLVVEASDLLFAVDSIPAVFAVTTDPFIVFTSNVFAILGLRSMYFLLVDVIDRFASLKIGLAFVLVFVGAKMLLVDVFPVPVGLSLAGIVLILLGSVLWSIMRKTQATDSAVPVSPRDLV
jgi:tellurite resistance protein TerC